MSNRIVVLDVAAREQTDFVCQCSVDHRDLTSFPTGRSSDRRILRQPEYKVVERNRVAVFECKVKHDPTLVPTMIWLKDNAELPADERYTHHTHTHTHVCPYTHKHACVSTQTHTHCCISLCSSVFYYNILLLLLYNYIQYYLTILA